MSDTLAGLTRRVQSFVYDQETQEELSHMLEEVRENCDGADALIELALGETIADSELEDELATLVAEAAEIDDLDDEEEDEEDGEFSDEEIASAAAELEALEDENGENDEPFEEAVHLLPGEVLII